MKTAIYIADGVLQVVLTPEAEQEKAILNLVKKKNIVTLYRGSFYECQGGWVRQRQFSSGFYGEADYGGESLILVLKEPEVEAEPPFDPPTP